MNELEQLRNLLNLTTGKSQLNESTGLAGRMPGDEFISLTNSPSIYWQNVKFYPTDCEGVCGYDTSEEMLEVIETMENDIDISWENKRRAQSKAFTIVEFKNENNKKLYFGRFFDKLKIDRRNQFSDNKLNGYKYNSKASRKEASGMKPTEILTEFENLNAEQIIDQVSKSLGKNHVLTNLTRMVASGQSFPISFDAPKDIEFKAFHDYFCEILHPLALHNGTTTGNADEAEEFYFGNSGFASSLISYGDTATGGLSDSIIKGHNGEELKISSKGAGTGADASVKGLKQSINELHNPKLKLKYAKSVHLIDNITSLSGKQAPIQLAVEFGMLSKRDQNTVNIKFPEWAQEGAQYTDFLDGGSHRKLISKTLQKFYDNRVPKNTKNANAWPHMIASIAYPVAEYVNTNKTLNFSKSMADILNNSALITIKTRGSANGNKWTLNMFKSEFPSIATTDVLLSAAKEYMSTSSRGGYVFKILFNGTSPDPIIANEKRAAEGDGDVSLQKQSISKNKQKKQTKRLSQQIKRKEFNTDKTDDAVFGRSKQVKGRDKFDNWFTDRPDLY